MYNSLFRKTKSAIQVTVLVKANSSRTLLEFTDNEIIARIKARRQKGKANKELIKILAEYFQIPSSYFNIVHGNLSTTKIIEIKNTNFNELIQTIKNKQN